MGVVQRLIGLMVLLISTVSPLHAQGEHSRRVAAELLVIAADLRHLGRLATQNSELVIQRGLLERVRGGLAPIELLLRLADAEHGRQPERYLVKLQRLHDLLEKEAWYSAAAGVGELARQFPLKQPAYAANLAVMEIGREIHQRHCAACHDNPAMGASISRPAYNLFKQVHTMPSIEFYARMIVGVRGDRVTGIDNPLSDGEISGLVYYYKMRHSDSN